MRTLDSLKGKTVLIVDDDPRNIFAVKTLLEGHGMKTLHAENGRAGIVMLERHPEIDIALIDIMMPEMDGYETMRLIRANPGEALVADDRGDGEGTQGRSRALHGGRRVGLPRQADRRRAVGRADSNLGRRLATAGIGVGG